MSLKDEVLAALAAGGLSPLHRFGQNFMIDGGALQTLVQELALTSALMKRSAVVPIPPGSPTPWTVTTSHFSGAGGSGAADCRVLHMGRSKEWG